MSNKTIPDVALGDEIYINSRIFISRGSDDFAGGRAKVSKVREQISGGAVCLFVEVEEDPGTMHNWSQHLALKQEELQGRYGEQRAHPDPDIDTPWIEPGDIVNGQVYKGDPIW